MLTSTHFKSNKQIKKIYGQNINDGVPYRLLSRPTTCINMANSTQYVNQVNILEKLKKIQSLQDISCVNIFGK